MSSLLDKLRNAVSPASLANPDKSLDPTGILKGPATRPTPVQDAPQAEELATVAAFMLKRGQAKEARLSREKRWEYNNLYAKGEQLIVRNSANGDILRVVADDSSKQKYSVDNLCRPTIRASVGKHIRVVPGVAVIPGGCDRSDFLQAEMLEAYKDYFERAEKLRLKYKRANEYLPTMGTAIFQLAWDYLKGRTLAWCQKCDFVSEFFDKGAPCPYCEEQALMTDTMVGLEAIEVGIPAEMMPKTPVPPLSEVFEGSLTAMLHDVRDFYMDPGAVELDSAQWCFIERALPVAAIRRRFPEAADKVVVETGLYHDKYISYAGALSDSRVETAYLHDYARLYEYHEMPSAEFPDGQLVYICNSRVLEQRANPYVPALKRLPFYAVRGDRNPGEFYGEAWMDNAVGVQKEYNKLLTQMRTIRELNLIPQMIVEANSGIAMDSVTSVPGQVYRKNRGFSDPRPIERQQLPAYVEAEVVRMANSIKQKAGVTDQELGLSSGAPSGRYAAILDAQSSETIAPILIENSEEWLELYRGAFLLAQRYESPTKRWQVQGHSRIKSFHWDQVNVGWDIQLADEDMLSKNPALRLQQSQELLQAGVFTNQDTGMPDMKAFSRYAKLKMPTQNADLESSAHAYAAQIPDMLARGVPVTPAPWDDANIMAEELLAWLRGPGMNADKQLVGQVAELWLLYATAMQPTMSAMEAMPMRVPPGMAGKGGSQPNPSPYEGQGPGRQPSAGGEANDMVKQADAGGEQMARGSLKHE
jgi:hypothetical protein